MHGSFITLATVFALLSGAAHKGPSFPYGSDTGSQITFDTLVHDYGDIPFGGDGRCSFRFTNTGDAPLIIDGFRSSCGCLVPSWDKEPVMPGTSGTVRLKYDTYRVGPISKSATLTSNAINTPTVVLRIKGTVLPDTTDASIRR